jgi:plastocyanin
MLRRTLLSLSLATLCGSALAADTATLKAKFIFGGDAPAQQKINPNKDIEFCGKTELLEEKLIVNPENKGIQNVVLYVFTGRGGTPASALPEVKAEPKTITLANDKCRFEPHIVVARVGDTIDVTNPDEVGHNANMNFLNNSPVNFTIPPKGHKEVVVKKDEPAPIPVDCNIHPWMRSYLVVLEHPFVDVSDENGELVIEGLPAGTELTFRVYHESAAGAIDKVKVGGKDENWARSRMKITLKPGMNDLGEVVIPASLLGK